VGREAVHDSITGLGMNSEQCMFAQLCGGKYGNKEITHVNRPRPILPQSGLKKLPSI